MPVSSPYCGIPRSGHSLHFNTSFGTAASRFQNFTDALAAEAQRAKDGKTSCGYKGKGFYARALTRYFNRFDRSRIRVYLSEDLFDKPVWMMRDLLSSWVSIPDSRPTSPSVTASLDAREASGSSGG